MLVDLGQANAQGWYGGCSAWNVNVCTDDGRVVTTSEHLSVDKIRSGWGIAHSSRVMRFMVFEQLAATSFPVADEPVKLILSILGCEVIHGPRLSSPLKHWKTPGGK